MLDRFENILKIICLGLAALLLVRGVHRLVHADPLGHASIPPLPALSVQAETNKPSAKPPSDTKPTGAKETNIVAKVKPPRHGGPRMGGRGPSEKFPPAIQARIDRIKESEILGPFMRPMPMALLGIADDDAFLRGPDGQTGLVKEGGELGSVKLLRIGINRVLVEEDGEKKELTLFDGLGGASLLPKETAAATNAPNATNTENHKEKP